MALAFALHGHDINSIENVQIIEQAKELVFIYSGLAAEDLRKAMLLNCGKKVHPCSWRIFLPHFLGGTTNYYSLIANGTMGATLNIVFQRRLTVVRS